ncbi:MAG: hypothetical protein GYB65_03040, partial [Chloroflexi bacterium]|nr:hypothetical protein [Chloroflexota bacterium]
MESTASVSTSPSDTQTTRRAPRWWRWLRWLPITLITLVAVVITLEVTWRRNPEAIPLKACQSSDTLGNAYCQTHFDYDDPLRLGYVFKPGYSFAGDWNPADPLNVDAVDETCGPFPDHTFYYTFQADDNGFINNATPWLDQYDIVVTGDSFSMPFAPVWWVDVLAEETGMDVLNLGMNGWGTISEAEAVRMYGMERNPRWVVLLYFEGNDLFNIEEYQRRQESGYDWRTYQLKQVAPLERYVMPHMLRYWRDELQAAFQDEEEPVCRYPMTVSTNVNTFETVFFTPHILQLSWTRDDILASDGWTLFTQTILDLQRDLAAQNTRLLVVYVPSKERLYWRRLWDEVDVGHFLELTSSLRTFAELDAHIDDQMALVEGFALANDIEFVNLTGEFWQRTMIDGQEYYNFADVHWNADGNQLVGEL